MRLPTVCRVSLAVLALAAALGAAAPAGQPLLPEHKRWLEDVSPIITRAEREVFEALRTSPEREKFIRLFWRQRDPAPDTPENEFRSEYEARVRFADETFGHGTSGRGSRTERGYYYLLLGAPLERTFFTTMSQIWPCELWFYKGDPAVGLPPYFHLIFYQYQGLGEYKLYYPGAEGPERLVVQPVAGSRGRNKALQEVKNINAELARASLSYIPGEQPFGNEAFSSDSLIATIRRTPEKRVNDLYARGYSSYKDFVETEHLDTWIGSNAQARVFTAGGRPFLHWTVEPDRMDFAQTGATYHAAFELVLRLEGSDGRPLYEATEEIPLRLTAEQYKANERRRLAFQDLLPVIPGDHRLFVMLKNRTGRSFTSFQAPVSVPAGPSSASGALLLHHGVEPAPAGAPGGLRAFTFSGRHYLVGAANEFLPGEKLGVFLQADLSRPEARGGSLLLEVVDTAGKTAASLRTAAAGVASPAEGLDLGPVDLAALPPGYYLAQVSLVDAEEKRLWTTKSTFVLLARPAPVAPWVFAKTHPAFPAPEHRLALAGQLFLAGRHDAARAEAEAALKERDTPAARLLLAKSLYGLKRYRESLAALAAPAGEVPGREAAKVAALDLAALGDWAAAGDKLDALLAEATEVGVLNLAAECRLRLGRPGEALALIKKSLSLDPAQPSLEALRAEAEKAAGKGAERREESPC